MYRVRKKTGWNVKKIKDNKYLIEREGGGEKVGDKERERGEKEGEKKERGSDCFKIET